MTAQPSILTDWQRAGLYRVSPTALHRLQASAKTLGQRWNDLNLDNLALADALTALGRQLDLPDWYGANLDALYDCLCDPQAFPAPRGFVLVFSHLSAAHAPLLEVLADVQPHRNGHAHPAWILLPSTWNDFALLADA